MPSCFSVVDFNAQSENLIFYNVTIVTYSVCAKILKQFLHSVMFKSGHLCRSKYCDCDINLNNNVIGIIYHGNHLDKSKNTSVKLKSSELSVVHSHL